MAKATAKPQGRPAAKVGAVAPAPSPQAAQAPLQPTTRDALKAFMEKAQRQVLPVTYWFDPAEHSTPYSVTVRFTGRRVDVEGKPQRRDRFVHDETIAEVLPGSGPISISALVQDIHPGKWEVSAEILRPAALSKHAVPLAPGQPLSDSRKFQPVARFWHRWVPSVDGASSIKTCATPYALTPGAVPHSWISMVVLGMALALLAQALVAPRMHLAAGKALVTALIAIGDGIVGAKIWFVVKHRKERLIDGWCIQGFIAGAGLGAIASIALFRLPGGTILDATTPGLLLGLAVGRVGCYFAGCCGGPPTAVRWGVWSSDQRVGARRVPTQLMESSLSLVMAVLALTLVLWLGTRGGAFFVAALAIYTLGREVLLDLRLERRQHIGLLGVRVVPVLAALMLVAAFVFIVR